MCFLHGEWRYAARVSVVGASELILAHGRGGEVVCQAPEVGDGERGRFLGDPFNKARSKGLKDSSSAGSPAFSLWSR